MSKPVSKFYLEFKFLQNVMIDFGDGVHYGIPTVFKAITSEAGHEAVVPQFDLDHVHRVKLQDEMPRVPKPVPGTSQRYHEELCDRAYAMAAKNKEFNDVVRHRVDHYVQKGVLAIVSDPFATETREDVDEADQIPEQKPPKSKAEKPDATQEPEKPPKK